MAGLWDAYTKQDAVFHNAVLTDDYRAVHPDGTIHIGRPTAQEIAAGAIASYELSDLRIRSAGAESVLVTYTAEVEIPTGSRPQTENQQAASRSSRGQGDRKGASRAGAETSRRHR